MEFDRESLDIALAVLAILLAFSTFVDTSVGIATLAAVLNALASINPVFYLVVVAALGVLFMAYGFLYLPGSESTDDRRR